MDKFENIEVLVDKGSTNIPNERYEELVRKEAALELVEKMYRSNAASYSYDGILALIFGEKGAGENA